MSTHRIFAWAAIAAAASLTLPAAATAAPKPEKAAQAAILKALADCRAIGDSAERLACFDKTSADLVQAESSGAVVVIDRQQIHEARRQAFGFDLAALNFFNRGLSVDEANSLTDEVAAANQRADGRWVLTLKSGAVWREVESDPPNRDPHSGSAVLIKRAALGSFVMKIDGQVAIKVKRVE
jgi:hypothetical protein